jgi:hypothetical protein
MFILGGIVLLIIGVLMFCFPDAVYSITELWKSDYSGGPSDSYKVHIRIKSVVVLFFGIFFIVAHFLIP